MAARKPEVMPGALSLTSIQVRMMVGRDERYPSKFEGIEGGKLEVPALVLSHG